MTIEVVRDDTVKMNDLSKPACCFSLWRLSFEEKGFLFVSNSLVMHDIKTRDDYQLQLIECRAAS